MGSALASLGAEDAECLGSRPQVLGPWCCCASDLSGVSTSAAPFFPKVSIPEDIPACPLSGSPCEQFGLRSISGVGDGLLVASASCTWHEQEERPPRRLADEPCRSSRVYGEVTKGRGA